jgi:hypothetical protein
MKHPWPDGHQQARASRLRECGHGSGPRVMFGVEVGGGEQAAEAHLGGCFDEAREIRQRWAAMRSRAQKLAVGRVLAEPE